ncbi:MAG: class I SAM-dependent methyltransferase [Planctomycetota bacterium]
MTTFDPDRDLEHVELDLPPLSVRLRTVRDPEALYDRFLELGDEHPDYQDERIPYWAELWPSAIALARFVAREGLARPGVAVTEIGCGFGLCGIAAALLGAQVVLSDYSPDALAFARANFALNRASSQAAEPRYVQMDWRTPDPTFAADLVLASDVVYERRALEWLPGALATLIRPAGRALVAEPGRSVAEPLPDLLRARGLTASELAIVPIVYGSRSARVRILEVTHA